MASIRELAERTPVWRERHVDLLRAVAITAVVVGHWLIMVVEYDRRGVLDGTSALQELTWAHPVTWLFQVMPVFFMVGGFANALSLRHHGERGGTAAQWLLDRGARLVRPTAVLIVALGAGAVAARLLGAAPDQIGRAVWLATLPLWFLVVYLGVVACAPVLLRLHQRAGLAVPVVLLLPVVAGDLLRLRTGDEAWAYGNFAFAWLAIHQLGFAWRDGLLPGRGGAVALLAGGLGGLVLLTVTGPYPVSMVTVPGAAMQNSSPPSLALVALALAQLGLALLLAGPAQRWLRRPRLWLAVVAANAVILTVFLWHMTAAVLATVVLHLLDRLPTPDVRSGEWLLWRVPWLAALSIVLAALVLVCGRVEMLRTRAPDRPIWLVAAGYLAVIVGLLWQAVAGSEDHGPFAMPTGALLLFLAGAAVLLIPRTGARLPSH